MKRVFLLPLPALLAVSWLCGIRPLAAEPPPASSPTAAEATPLSVSAPAKLDFSASDDETRQTRAEILRRIDAMPSESKETKDRLYHAVESARGMGQILTIGFDLGKLNLSARNIADLKVALGRPDMQGLVKNPAVLFIVLGFAESKGHENSSFQVTLVRAQRVVEALRGPCGLTNDIHAMGMGIIDADQERSHVAEVWAVQP